MYTTSVNPLTLTIISTLLFFVSCDDPAGDDDDLGTETGASDTISDANDDDDTSPSVDDDSTADDDDLSSSTDDDDVTNDTSAADDDDNSVARWEFVGEPEIEGGRFLTIVGGASVTAIAMSPNCEECLEDDDGVKSICSWETDATAYKVTSMNSDLNWRASPRRTFDFGLRGDLAVGGLRFEADSTARDVTGIGVDVDTSVMLKMLPDGTLVKIASGSVSAVGLVPIYQQSAQAWVVLGFNPNEPSPQPARVWVVGRSGQWVETDSRAELGEPAGVPLGSLDEGSFLHLIDYYRTGETLDQRREHLNVWQYRNSTGWSLEDSAVSDRRWVNRLYIVRDSRSDSYLFATIGVGGLRWNLFTEFPSAQELLSGAESWSLLEDSEFPSVTGSEAHANLFLDPAGVPTFVYTWLEDEYLWCQNMNSATWRSRMYRLVVE